MFTELGRMLSGALQSYFRSSAFHNTLHHGAHMAAHKISEEVHKISQKHDPQNGTKNSSTIKNNGLLKCPTCGSINFVCSHEINHSCSHCGRTINVLARQDELLSYIPTHRTRN